MTQPPAPPSPNSPVRVQIELPANLSALYSNAAIISQTPSEIILDFVQIMPNVPRHRVQTRIVMTPANAKLLLQALSQNLARYETLHGELKVQPLPATLADQLFSSIKPDDTEAEGEHEQPG